MSALWSNINRGKRSIVLDLKADADVATMKKLLATADVLVENWRPHVANSLGLGQDVVATLNPRLVRLSVTGFGDSGPLVTRPPTTRYSGHTGMVHLLSPTGAPDVAPYWVVDKVVATFASQAVLAALFERERTGKGSHVSLPMLDVMAYFNFPDMFQHRTFVKDETPWRPAFTPVVRTSDGYVIVTPVNGGQISRTLKALGRPDIKEEMLSIKSHVEMVDRFYKRLNEIMAQKPTAHWLALFGPHDVPIAPVRTLDEHLADEQVKHNRIYREVPTSPAPCACPATQPHSAASNSSPRARRRLSMRMPGAFAPNSPLLLPTPKHEDEHAPRHRRFRGPLHEAGWQGLHHVQPSREAERAHLRSL